MSKDLNRIKGALADKKKTNKWLSEQLGVAPTTVSKWCTNDCQPPMETFIIAKDSIRFIVNCLKKFPKLWK